MSHDSDEVVRNKAAAAIESQARRVLVVRMDRPNEKVIKALVKKGSARKFIGRKNYKL